MLRDAQVEPLLHAAHTGERSVVGKDGIDSGATRTFDHANERPIRSVGGEGPPIIRVEDSEVLPPPAGGSGADEVIGVKVHVKVSAEED